MSDLNFTRITSNNATDNAAMMVVLWDLGPQKPEPPVRPEAPQGKEGTPAYDLAMVDFRQSLEEYDAALKAHKQAKTDFADFEKRYGGPYEISMWSCDAEDALSRDPTRYCISSKTRGHGRKHNGGLPRHLKPGHGHEENLRREAEGYADAAAVRRTDPVFGPLEARE